MLTLHMARMCSGVGVIHVGIILSSSGLPGRKTDALTEFCLCVMHKVVLGLAWMITEQAAKEQSIFTSEVEGTLKHDILHMVPHLHTLNQFQM